MWLSQHYPKLCKQNLHLIICRLISQIEQCGLPMNELWVERTMQKFKRKTKQRSTSSPEIVAAHTMENERGLSSTRHQFPEHCRTFDELLLSVRAVPLSGRNVDEGVSSTGTQLMHRGKRPHPEAWDTIRQSINHMVCVLDHESIDGWNPADNIQQRAIDEMDVWVHTAANVRGNERIQSVANRSARSRSSKHVLVEFRYANGTVRNYIGVV